MNNYPFNCVSNKCFYRLVNLFLHLFSALLFQSLIASGAFGQKSVWRYVATAPGGSKTFLNDEIKTLPNKNKARWEKAVKTDGSFVIALAEWNCKDKMRLTRQITFYDSDQSVIATKKTGFEWSPIIPGSAADFLYSRVCLPAPPISWARITANRAALRAFPDAAAPTIRTARQGEQFQIVAETGKGGWFNVVDAATQEDYWLFSNSFEIASASAKKSNATAKKDFSRKKTSIKIKKKQ